MNANSRNYFFGILWFFSHSITSVFNDVIMKYTGIALPSFEVAFFRFLFSALSLIPVILYYGKESIKTTNYSIHLIRGALLFLGISAWIYGLRVAPVVTATVISFSVPLFTLILALFFLNENIIWQRWVVTIIGLIGITIVLKPTSEGFNPESLVFVIAAVAFASLDIINKRVVSEESMISMMFYPAIVTTLLSAPLTLSHFVVPSPFDLLLLFILGCSANLILFFVLRAFSLVDATALAPYRYFELFFSAVAGYIIFHERPENNILYGALIIIPSTLFIIYSEQKKLESYKLNA